MEGGISIRRVSEISEETFSYKLWFRFRQQESLWAKYIDQKYCKDRFPGSLALKNTDSIVWKRMHRISSAAQEKCFWKIGRKILLLDG